MSYPQFGYAAFTPATQLMVSGGGGSNGSSPCCGGGDVSSRTSTSGGVVDSCSIPATYDSRLLTTYHPRLYEHNFDSAFYPTLGPAYSMKDGADPWRGIAPSASYYYDPSLAAYGYGGLDFNGARRKNVTRDSTSTLKAWLNEHRKNPYPTKGEKIMLAIITKMTLTQVSTWFANARRRLKKENKMTWEPRNKMDADDVKDYDDDDDDADEKEDDHPSKRNEDRTNARCDSEDEGRHCEDNGTARCYNTTTSRPYPLLPPKHSETTDFPPTENSSSSPHLPDIQALMRTSGKDSKDVPDSAKPKIWSLADTATSKSPPPPPPSLHDAHSNGSAGMTDMLGHCGWFSVNPYQVTGTASTSLGGFSGYPPHASCGGFTPPQAGHSSGFVPPQTDTPPQTPPNMKVVSSSGYIAGSQGYQTNGHINPISQVTSKNNASYPLSANPLANRSFRADTTPEDYSATGHFRAGTLQ